MLTLLEIREMLKFYYAKYDAFIIAFCKFTLALSSIYALSMNIGYVAAFNTPLVTLIIALLCAILPYGLIACILSLYILANIYAVSLEMTLLLSLIFVVVLLLYYSFRPRDSVLLILTPLFCVFKIPYAIAMIVGLCGSMLSAIPISCGLIVYYILSYIKGNISVVHEGNAIDIAERYSKMINGALSNKNMLLMIMACVITIVIVNSIKRLSIDYSWYIAIASGGISVLVVSLMGDFVFGIRFEVLQLLLSILISALLALIYSFFVFSVDYSRTEYTQFEDDDYYYYVKAVPKLVVQTPRVKIRHFTSKKTAVQQHRQS